jgi:hypothetical protein
VVSHASGSARTKLILLLGDCDVLYRPMFDMCSCVEAESERNRQPIVPIPSHENLPRSIPEIIESEPSQLSQRCSALNPGSLPMRCYRQETSFLLRMHTPK